MDRASLGECHVLVLSDMYTTFAKNQVDVLADRVESVTVLVRYNRLADIGEYLPISALEPHKRSSRIDRTEKPANVTVIAVPIISLPLASHYDKLGEKFLAGVRKALTDGGNSLSLAAIVDRFDLVHAHFTWPCGYVAARLADAGLPAVLTVHANEHWLRELAESGRPGVHEAWRGVDAIIRVNQKDVPLLEQYNANVVSIPNGFTRGEFPSMNPEQARRTLGLDPKADVVFGLGALNERKRWRDLIEAMETVVDDREHVVCGIAGRGKLKRKLKRQIRDAGLQETVQILGYLSQSDAASWMNAADMLVLASEAEGNPTVMFEALGCGTPYVGTSVGGAPEIIDSDAYGLLSEPGDVRALAANITRGLDREWDRERIRAYASQFTWDSIVDRTIDEVYSEVLGLPEHDAVQSSTVGGADRPTTGSHRG